MKHRDSDEVDESRKCLERDHLWTLEATWLRAVVSRASGMSLVALGGEKWWQIACGKHVQGTIQKAHCQTSCAVR